MFHLPSRRRWSLKFAHLPQFYAWNSTQCAIVLNTCYLKAFLKLDDFQDPNPNCNSLRNRVLLLFVNVLLFTSLLEEIGVTCVQSKRNDYYKCGSYQSRTARLLPLYLRLAS